MDGTNAVAQEVVWPFGKLDVLGHLIVVDQILQEVAAFFVCVSSSRFAVSRGFACFSAFCLCVGKANGSWVRPNYGCSGYKEERKRYSWWGYTKTELKTWECARCARLVGTGRSTRPILTARTA